VFVQLEADAASLVGPRQTVRKLAKMLSSSPAAYSAHAA
jgi:hypothetical protein